MELSGELNYVVIQDNKYPQAYFENVIFKDVGQKITQYDSLMTYQDINLKMINCSFIIGNKVIPPSWNLIQIGSNDFIGINITVDLKDSTPLLSHVSIFSFNVAIFKNLRILCPIKYQMKEPTLLGHSQVYMSCEKYCHQDQYSLQYGEAVLYKSCNRFFQNEPSLFNTTDPTCFSCPIGAQCGHTIISLPAVL